MSDPQQPSSQGPTRRQVLRGAGIAAAGAGVAMTLGACSGGSEGSSGKPTPTPAAEPVTVPKAKVPVGNGAILERKYVVTQPTEGTYKAFTKVCPHGGCAVSFIKQEQIVCACHGSEFSITDGARTAGPAKTGLAESPVKVDGDNLIVG